MQQTMIRVEAAKDLTTEEKLRLLRAAYAAGRSPQIRTKLALLLLQDDAFTAVIDLFDGHDDLDFDDAMFLVQAHLALETAQDNAAAQAVAERAVALASYNYAIAAALADRAKAQTRLGDTAAARGSLTEALRRDPTNKNACKRLAALDLADNHPAAVVAMTDQLAAAGATHARLMAARALAQVRLEAIDEARATIGFDALHVAQQLPPPPGWNSIAAFNAALAAELLAHPDIRYERYGAASKLTWRIDDPVLRGAPLVQLLIDQIAIAVRHCVDQLAGVDHPWVRGQPALATLHGWCVITDGEGHETWHVHQFGWLSGVYYVQVPDAIALGNDVGGCIAFGLPDDLAGEAGARAYGDHIVRPQNGLMLAFPSHCYHRTFPHDAREQRIALAFDLRPD